MKKIILLLLLITPFLCQAQETGVKFETTLTWAQVKAKAKSENKYIFVDCYATWCGPCKMMDRDVYPDAKVGQAVNSKFVSVKVQMDRTAGDGAYVKNWYAAADELKAGGYVTAYPCFLFFTPDGKIVYSELGYRSPEEFIKITESALDPEKARYYVRVIDYRNGIKDYANLGDLSIWTKKIMRDTSLSEIMAKDFKTNWVDKQQPLILNTPGMLDFIVYNSQLINSHDPFFELIWHHEKAVDSVRKVPGWSRLVANLVITREELESKTVQNIKPISKHPNWNKLQSDITLKYPEVDARKLVIDFQLKKYYLSVDQNWPKWVAVKDQQIKEYPPKQISDGPKNKYGLGVYVGINGFEGAWLVFSKCNDKRVLKKAVEWEDLAIKLDGVDNLPAYLDTKANLLYKLGHRSEAMTMEQDAIDALIKANPKSQVSDLKKALERMRNFEPTYTAKDDPQTSAIWTVATLPKKN